MRNNGLEVDPYPKRDSDISISIELMESGRARMKVVVHKSNSLQVASSILAVLPQNVAPCFFPLVHVHVDFQYCGSMPLRYH